MPSLRRSMSSPSVRSSPYPLLSSAVNSAAGSRGNGHRRSSGSETNSRRVLADIEWWRVADGQRDSDADQESEDHNRDQNFDHLHGRGLAVEHLLRSVGGSTADIGVGRPATPPAPVVQTSLEAFRPFFTDEFAALSITPHSPLRRHHSRQSSSSSLESTPEAEEPSFGGLRLNISDADLGFFDAPPTPTLANRKRGCRAVSAPFLSLRAHSFSDKLSTPSPYADFTVSPLSSASPLLFN
ncbi:hypothetical protein BDZ94DRAFT_1244258 [Collybia nuda]|uniref:Uncharacterized protein n=1 Tax=Collybia nuda TaxID=64659 RepID=A0A9P5YI50_9AGAR|nr:hypothetical protein BDZ94DRAFT_1244258 [Collybia nuda]